MNNAIRLCFMAIAAAPAPSSKAASPSTPTGWGSTETQWFASSTRIYVNGETAYAEPRELAALNDEDPPAEATV